MSASIEIRNANSLWRRGVRHLRQWRGAQMGKTHQVHLVTINGERFKRVTFALSEEAAAVAAGLQALSGLGRFPALVAHDDRQVWMDFVPGRLASRGDADRVADFFTDLYQHRATRVEAGATDFPEHLATNLAFLGRSGVIPDELVLHLQAVGRELQPQFLALGHDYIDPVLKNFVISEDRAVGIDVEALASGLPLGFGLAKARLRWLGGADQSIMQHLDGSQGADLRQQYPWVRLCFLAGYFRQKVLQRKPRLIKLEALAEFLTHKKTPPGGGVF